MIKADQFDLPSWRCIFMNKEKFGLDLRWMCYQVVNRGMTDKDPLNVGPYFMHNINISLSDSPCIMNLACFHDAYILLFMYSCSSPTLHLLSLTLFLAVCTESDNAQQVIAIRVYWSTVTHTISLAWTDGIISCIKEKWLTQETFKCA